VLIALAPALTTLPADEPPGLHVALAFHEDEPHRLRDEVVAHELPGRTRDLDLVIARTSRCQIRMDPSSSQRSPANTLEAPTTPPL
jgi:hypothetical protein